MAPPKAETVAVAASRKECFVIAPIGEPESKIRERSDLVLKFVIEKAVSPLGYDVVRADKISEPGYITIQVLQKLQKSALVVADLTGHNPNVFYELAVRHAVNKPVIQIIDSSEKIPFDVTGLRVVKFDHRNLESVEKAKDEIQRYARQALNGVVGDTPITLASITLKLSVSEGQDKLVAQGLGRILEELSALRAEIRNYQELGALQSHAGFAALPGWSSPITISPSSGLHNRIWATMARPIEDYGWPKEEKKEQAKNEPRDDATRKTDRS